MTELMNIMLGLILEPNPEPSLLHQKDAFNDLAPITFYMNNLFEGYDGFESLYLFLKHHFFPRIEWVKLCITFKKLRIEVSKIVALSIVHLVKGCVHILKS